MITERLQAFIDHQGISINAAADLCGLQRSTVHKALRTGRGLHSDTLIAVLTTWPTLSADWLLLGKGDMLRRPASLQLSSTLEDTGELQRYREQNYQLVNKLLGL